MKSLRVERLKASLLFTSTMICLLVYLVACTPSSLSSNDGTTLTTVIVVNADITATQAIGTIEAALQSQITATITSTLAPLPPSAAADNSEKPVISAAQTIEAVLLATNTPSLTPTPSSSPTTSPTPNLAATATSDEQRLMKALAERDATATAEIKRLTVVLAGLLTALPTATPDLTATENALNQKLATALAATLTAQPTTTATPTATWTATATPDLAATQTANAQAMATSVAATLTAQPTATPPPTVTPIPTATWTPVPTATPTPDFKPLIVDYRRAERAALQSLDPNVLAQLPVFASGEALVAINQQAETLRAAGQYQILVVEEIQVVQTMLGPTIGVLTQERHTQQTLARTAEGDQLVTQETATLTVVYGLINEDGRWKINRVRLVKTE